MQTLNTLWQVVNAASTVKEITQHKKIYHFAVTAPITLYLHVESARVQVIRWPRPVIEMTVQLQGAFGWRIATEQDEAGVYVAARRRAVVGGLSRAAFELRVPYDTYLVLKLDDGALQLENVDGTFHVPPPGDGPARLDSGEA